MQQTTFPVQILIHDDASHDGTAEIIKEYQSKYPELIKAWFQKENTYKKQNSWNKRAIFRSWRIGKYEALCEGDDYWTDPLKLQKQVEYMESHSNVALCAHGGMILKEATLIEDKRNRRFPYSVSKFDLIQGNPFLTASVCFKISELSFETWTQKVPFGDYRLYFEAICQGKIIYLPENMCVYRVHSKGAWSANESNALGIIRNLHKTIKFYKLLKINYPLNVLEKTALFLKIIEQKLLLYKIFKSRHVSMHIIQKIRVLLPLYIIRFITSILKAVEILIQKI